MKELEDGGRGGWPGPHSGVAPTCDDEGTSVLSLGSGQTDGLDVVSQLDSSGQGYHGHVKLGDPRL